MDSIGNSTLWSYCDDSVGIQKVTSVTQVRRASGNTVVTYLELAARVAELQFKNQDYYLMFRGSRRDYRNHRGNTSLKPRIFRPRHGAINPPDREELAIRFSELRRAERHLISNYQRENMAGRERLVRHRILRWAILQHYQVCSTPVLDVTQSLRIAASFASAQAETEAFLYVLAVPNVSGAITASAEAGVQIIRLSSVCPPTALRPHIQEGYLLGEYPDMVDVEQKQAYKHYEVDFGRRLIAKFRFNPDSFWQDKNFPRVSDEALYPDQDMDPLNRLALAVKSALEDR